MKKAVKAVTSLMFQGEIEILRIST